MRVVSNNGSSNISVPGDLLNLVDAMGRFMPRSMHLAFSDFVRDSQNPRSMEKLARMGEKTYHGGKISTSMIPGLNLPLYNPDEIPVSTYEKMRLDPQISAGLAVIMMPPLSLGFRVECPNPKVKALVKWNMQLIRRRLMADMMTSVIYGFFHGEKIFSTRHVTISERSESGRPEKIFDGFAHIIDRVKANYPDSISFVLDDRENLKYARQETGSFSVDVPRAKTFLFTHQFEFGNYFGVSRLKASYKPWYWGELLMQFMLVYLEKMGTPVVVVRHPPGETMDTDGTTPITNSEHALRLGSAVIGNAVVTLPSDRDLDSNFLWDIEFKSPESRVTMFNDALKLVDNLKLRGLWVPERVLTQDISGAGAYNLADVHTDVFFFTEEGLVTDMDRAINEQIVPDIVEPTFPEADRDHVFVKTEQLNWNRKGILVQVFRDIVRGMFDGLRTGQVPSVLPLVEEIGEEIGVPVGPASDLYPFFNDWNDQVNNNVVTVLRRALEGEAK